jgi:hypothetical protein
MKILGFGLELQTWASMSTNIIWDASVRCDLDFEIVKKSPTFTKGTQLAPHATSGALWCQKMSRK